MKIPILFIILFLCIYSCNSIKNPIDNHCKGLLKNDYKSIRIENHYFSTNDTIAVNEVKYECVKTGFYLMKGMYDRFGKWNYYIKNSNNNNKSYLVWSDIQLFENDTMKFFVAASGNKGSEPINASVLVFNKQNQDLFNENSPYKSKLITYFSEMIKSNSSNKDFYEVYWKSIDPVMWENHKSAIEIQKNH